MMTLSKHELLPGKTHPIGVTVEDDGVNFCLYCDERVTAVELLLFAQYDAIEPYEIIQLDPLINRSFYFWHVFVKGLPEKTHYAYRVDGPYQPGNGLLFDKHKVLIDPYSKGNNHSLWNRADACKPGCNLHTRKNSILSYLKCRGKNGISLSILPYHHLMILHKLAKKVYINLIFVK